MAARLEDLRNERKWFAEYCGTGGELKLLANLVISYESATKIHIKGGLL
jgi:hypothetical protein